MKSFLFTIATIMLSSSLSAIAQQKPTYLLVHGAWGGGWAFKKTDSIMSKHGKEVYRASLTGQGERVHLNSTDIDLSTHIKDVVNMILYDKLENVILIGHSYGGMVITGVADSIPERIKKLVFLDAILPNDGESLATSRGSGVSGPEHSAKDGFMVPHWVKPDTEAPKDVQQSIKTFTQAVTFKKSAALKIPATYILTVDPGKKPDGDGFY